MSVNNCLSLEKSALSLQKLFITAPYVPTFQNRRACTRKLQGYIVCGNNLYLTEDIFIEFQLATHFSSEVFRFDIAIRALLKVAVSIIIFRVKLPRSKMHVWFPKHAKNTASLILRQKIAFFLAKGIVAP